VPPVSTIIKVTGKRLSGKDVYIKYGAVLLIKGVNTESNEVSITVQRSLSLNQPVSVIVDGRESNVLPPRLERIEPAQAYPGESMKLVGRSLSGQNVTVMFDNTVVASGPHAYGSEITVTVPPALQPGAKVKVSANVDGNSTNELEFEVIA
jgi:hypothetical protein